MFLHPHIPRFYFSEEEKGESKNYSENLLS